MTHNLKYSLLMTVAGLALLAGGCAQNKKPGQTQKLAFWPPYPDEPRLQFVISYQKSSDVEPPKSNLDNLIYGKEPQQDLNLAKPYGVKMWKGKIYVCDLRTSSVTVLDLRKRQTLVMGKTGAARLQRPSDITIAEDGTKYVSDIGAGTILTFDAQDKFVGTLTVPNLKPTGLAVYQNELYVCDFQSQSVKVLDRHNGKELRSIGSPGMEAGQFIRPLGIAVDKQGFIYVVDVMTCRVQKFDRSGKLVTNFGTISANAGGLVRPKHIAVDSQGILYIVDAAFQNVQLFDQKGQVLTYFGSAGTHPGAMYMPAGIAIDEEDLDLFKDKIHPAFQAERLVVVSNQFGDNKIAIYAMGHLKPGKTVADISASQGLVPAGTTTKPAQGLPAATVAPDDVTTQPTTEETEAGTGK